MIQVETSSVNGFVPVFDLRCQDPFLPAVERIMRDAVCPVDEAGNDTMLEPHFRLGWQLIMSDFGVTMEQTMLGGYPLCSGAISSSA